MTRRVAASLLALALALALAVVVGSTRAPFTVFTPGPTFNALGSLEGKQIIKITGHKTYPDSDGQLRFVTVYVTQPKQRISLFGAIVNWIDPDAAVLPHDAVYSPNETNKSSQHDSAVQMSDSQDDATAAALTAAGIKYTSHAVRQITVGEVDPTGPAAKLVAQGDGLVSIDGNPVTTADALVASISSLKPGTKVELGIRRDSVTKTVTITTAARPDDPSKSRVGITLGSLGDGTQFTFPFKVAFGLGGNIGGPSAGMMFALSIYDLLTPGSLSGGKVIAGSGEISPDGVVGPIGGIGQKLVGAQNDGARLFLVAAENCAEAAKAHYDKNKLRLVKVHTLSDAIKAITTWRENPKADLARCS